MNYKVNSSYGNKSRDKMYTILTFDLEGIGGVLLRVSYIKTSDTYLWLSSINEIETLLNE